MPWWDAQTHADRRPLLLKRGRVKAAIRGHFEAQGFTEVECGALVVSPGNETHLQAFETVLTGPDGAGQPRYLHTSPEFAAKKLLAAGEERIFDFARVFRNHERSRLHAPEFTMLEWYRAHEEYGVVIDDTLAVLKLAAQVGEAKALRHRFLVLGQLGEGFLVATHGRVPTAVERGLVGIHQQRVGRIEGQPVLTGAFVVGPCADRQQEPAHQQHSPHRRLQGCREVEVRGHGGPRAGRDSIDWTADRGQAVPKV